jgi:hypothetical protein
MLSAAQRQAILPKKAKKAKVQKKRARQAVQRAEGTAVQALESAAYERQDLLLRLGEARLEDAVMLVQDKHEELHGPSDLGYSAGQIREVNAIIAAYTPDEFAAALALANALTWAPDDSDEDNYGERAKQRRQQGRGLFKPSDDGLPGGGEVAAPFACLS